MGVQAQTSLRTGVERSGMSMTMEKSLSSPWPGPMSRGTPFFHACWASLILHVGGPSWPWRCRAKVRTGSVRGIGRWKADEECRAEGRGLPRSEQKRNSPRILSRLAIVTVIAMLKILSSSVPMIRLGCCLVRTGWAEERSVPYRGEVEEKLGASSGLSPLRQFPPIIHRARPYDQGRFSANESQLRAKD